MISAMTQFLYSYGKDDLKIDWNDDKYDFEADFN